MSKNKNVMLWIREEQNNLVSSISPHYVYIQYVLCEMREKKLEQMGLHMSEGKIEWIRASQETKQISCHSAKCYRKSKATNKSLQYSRLGGRNIIICICNFFSIGCDLFNKNHQNRPRSNLSSTSGQVKVLNLQHGSSVSHLWQCE